MPGSMAANPRWSTNAAMQWLIEIMTDNDVRFFESTLTDQSLQVDTATFESVLVHDQ